MSLEQKALIGTLWQSGTSWIGFAITFIINIAMARILFPEDYGVYAMGASFAEVFLILFSFSYGMAVVQMEEKDDLFETALSLSILTGLAIIIVSVILGFFLLNKLAVKTSFVFVSICFSGSLNGCASVYSSFSEKELKMRQNSIVRATSAVLAGVTSLVFALMGFGIWSLVAQNISYSIFLLFGMMKISAKVDILKFNLKTAKKIILFSVKGIFARGAEIAIFRIPNLFIGSFIGIKELGYFSRVMYLIMLPNTFFASATQYIAYPFFSKIQNKKEKILKTLSIMNYFMLRILSPLAIICAVFPGEVLNIVFGSNWLCASDYLRSLTILMLFLPVLNGLKTVTFSINKIEYSIKSYLAGVLLMAISMFVEKTLIKGSFVTLYSISMASIIFFLIQFLKAEKLHVRVEEILCLPAILTVITLFLADIFKVEIMIYQNIPVKLIFLIILYLVLSAFFFLYKSKILIEYCRLIAAKYR